MCKKILRSAIAMIELIFAIVVIGIVLMSAPQLMQTAAKSGYVSIRQEGISEAASHINMIMGYHWDENDTDERFADPILHTDSAIADLKISDNNRTRVGTPTESYRSYIRADGNSSLHASTIGFDSPESLKWDEDDIDDFNGETYNLKTEQNSPNADYIEKEGNIMIIASVSYSKDGTGTSGAGNYNISDITYTPFQPATKPTANIKSIEVNLTSASGARELQKEIILRAFSCNIGSYKLEERSF